jgi:hypothetical protein
MATTLEIDIRDHVIRLPDQAHALFADCARVYLTIDPESNTVVISREMPAVNNAQILAELAALS